MSRFPKGIKIKEARQHYLRFENPTTWQIHESLGLKRDSSMGYMTDAGFRAGTCRAYSVFNILTRKKLSLKEVPLIFMEQALAKKYQKKEDFYRKIIELKETVQKYSGTFVVLWHNNNFYTNEWAAYKEIYEEITGT